MGRPIPLGRRINSLPHKEIDNLILEIINQNRMRDQRAVLEELERRGYNINQSTLSRHLRKLGVKKEDGHYRYVNNKDSGLSEAQAVTKIALAPPNLIIIKTLPGHANAISWRLDEQQLEGIEGTVAGDDTVFIAVGSPEALAQVKDQLDRLFHK